MLIRYTIYISRSIEVRRRRVCVVLCCVVGEGESREIRIDIEMASNAVVPFWRAAGMTYVTYSNICANLVRNCLKEPHKSESISRERVHFSVSKWVDGKPQKPTVRSDDPEE